MSPLSSSSDKSISSDSIKLSLFASIISLANVIILAYSSSTFLSVFTLGRAGFFSSFFFFSAISISLASFLTLMFSSSFSAFFCTSSNISSNNSLSVSFVLIISSISVKSFVVNILWFLSFSDSIFK